MFVRAYPILIFFCIKAFYQVYRRWNHWLYHFYLSNFRNISNKNGNFQVPLRRSPAAYETHINHLSDWLNSLDARFDYELGSEIWWVEFEWRCWITEKRMNLWKNCACRLSRHSRQIRKSRTKMRRTNGLQRCRKSWADSGWKVWVQLFLCQFWNVFHCENQELLKLIWG